MGPLLSPDSQSAERLPLSCFIIAKNEAHRIGRTIASVIDWVDEVIVVEADSIDNTVEVAQRAGAKVIQHRWVGFGQQKRFAEEQCRNNWVLNLDADEVAPPGMHPELKALFVTGSPPLAAYAMRVHIVYPGCEQPRPFARDHLCIRFYDRARVRFKNSTLHDSVDPGEHSVGYLQSSLSHHTFTSLEDLAAKCDERATYSASHSSPRSLLALRLRSVIEYPLVFTKNYLLRRHFTGGRIGLMYSATIAHYRRQRILRMLAAKTTQATPDGASQSGRADLSHGSKGPPADSPQNSIDAT